MLDLVIRGVKIRVVEPDARGTERDPSFLFIHGAGGAASTWEAQSEFFKGTHLVYHLELPGHGGSLSHGEEEISAYAAWVRAALREMFTDRPYILGGHSMGGAVVLDISMDPPAGLAGIVLAGTGARLFVMQAIFDMLEKDPEAFYSTIDLAAFHEETPPEIRGPLIQAIRDCPHSVLLGDFRACHQFNMKDKLADIRLPALILCGEADRLTPVKLSGFLNENIRKSRFVLVPHAGHMVMAEQPEPVNRALEAFLAEIASGQDV